MLQATADRWSQSRDCRVQGRYRRTNVLQQNPGQNFNESAWMASGSAAGEAGRIGLAFRLTQMDLCAVVRRQVVLYVAFLDKAHVGSSGSGCVPERCSSGAKPGMPKARRENGLLLQAYARLDSRADGPALFAILTVEKQSGKLLPSAAFMRMASSPGSGGAGPFEPAQPHCYIEISIAIPTPGLLRLNR